MTSHAPTLSASRATERRPQSPLALQRASIEFLTGLNHAIRTPLSGILGLSELMMECPIGEEYREYLISIRSCAAALNELLSSTLEYASHLHGVIRLEEQDLPLITAIEAGLRDARQRAQDQGTTFECQLSDGLQRIVRTDALRLRDAVSLIARGAIHSVPGGKVCFRATLMPWGPRFGELILEARREEPAGSQLAMLSELGLESCEERLSRSFTREALELALVHRLIGLLRGSIRIGSEPNASIALWAALPVALVDLGLPSAQEDARPAGHAAASRPAILIADDNGISLRVLSSILGRAEFECVAVNSGPAALEALARRRFDLVLLDLLMPGMDGGITTRRIRELPNCAAVPILGITAGVTDELRENCRRNGMDAILDKPVDAAELVASVRFHLTRGALSPATSSQSAPTSGGIV